MITTESLGSSSFCPRISIYCGLRTMIDSIVSSISETSTDICKNKIYNDTTHTCQVEEVPNELITKEEREVNLLMDEVVVSEAIVLGDETEKLMNLTIHPEAGVLANSINFSSHHIRAYLYNEQTDERIFIVSDLPPGGRVSIDTAHSYVFVMFSISEEGAEGMQKEPYSWVILLYLCLMARHLCC